MAGLIGTIAVTDFGWYTYLVGRPGLEEANFWKPSATRAARAPQFSPYLFKLRAPHNAICGFGFFAGYYRLPDWQAWDLFGDGNGCGSLTEMRERIGDIRDRIRYRGGDALQVGCVLIAQPTFFPRERWVPPPRDWPPRTQVDKRYDLEDGEGRRIWEDCIAVAESLAGTRTLASEPLTEQRRHGQPRVVVPRLGQGLFRLAVTEAYKGACSVTGEHSLPALEAGHIRPFASDGPHAVNNGVLLRADIHRLFDRGYVTVTPNAHLVISSRLKRDFENGRSYYPLHGRQLRLPDLPADRPAAAYLRWHNERVFLD